MATPTLPRRRESGAILSPWRELGLLDDRVQRLFRSWPYSEGQAESFPWSPRVDLSEENGRYLLTAELPGIDPKDVDIEIEGNVLSFRGEKRMEREEEEERVRISERTYGAFERSFTLPVGTDPEKIEAEFNQGVLRIAIPKRAEARGKKIQVQAK